MFNKAPINVNLHHVHFLPLRYFLRNNPGRHFSFLFTLSCSPYFFHGWPILNKMHKDIFKIYTIVYKNAIHTSILYLQFVSIFLANHTIKYACHVM